MHASSPVYFELVEFIAAGTTPEAVVAFEPSPLAQDRIAELIARKRDEALSSEEESELEEFLHIEHILIMAKAQARRHLPVGQ